MSVDGQPLGRTDQYEPLLSWKTRANIALCLLAAPLALLARRVPVRARIPAIVLAALASLGWALIPISTPVGVNALNWPPAFFSWFAAGMLLAELTVSPVSWPHRLARRARGAAGQDGRLAAAGDVPGRARMTGVHPVRTTTQIHRDRGKGTV